MHVLPSKYVFKVKSGGPKVRIVVFCCRQLYGIDFFETFAPVVEMTTVRTILALVACADLECEQVDVVTAFLYGDLEEDIFMEVPDGFKNQNRANMVCKLQKIALRLKAGSSPMVRKSPQRFGRGARSHKQFERPLPLRLSQVVQHPDHRPLRQ